MPRDASNFPPHRLGIRGERMAEAYLVEHGWTVLAREFRFGRREVDLIVRRGRVLAFVEVKTRAGLGFGDPLEAITWKKRREIEAVAAYFLARRGMWTGTVRFDAVAVMIRAGETPRLRHIEDAWRPGQP